MHSTVKHFKKAGEGFCHAGRVIDLDGPVGAYCGYPEGHCHAMVSMGSKAAATQHPVVHDTRNKRFSRHNQIISFDAGGHSKPREHLQNGCGPVALLAVKAADTGNHTFPDTESGKQRHRREDVG